MTIAVNKNAAAVPRHHPEVVHACMSPLLAPHFKFGCVTVKITDEVADVLPPWEKQKKFSTIPLTVLLLFKREIIL